MKNKLQAVFAMMVAAAIIASSSGCSSKPKNGAGVGAAYGERDQRHEAASVIRYGEPGGITVSTYQETATVTSVDKASRRITLLTPGGAEMTSKAGPEVANFDQIEPGDKVRATLTEQLIVFVRDSHEPPTQQQSRTLALAPAGSKPGGVVADTIEMTAKVVAIDVPRHEATVQFPDGRTQTFKVRNDVDLTKRRVGEEVVIHSTEAIAVSVEKP
jgi:hypothetical protein